MVAYSFKKQFIPPIRVGLGLPAPNSFRVTPPTLRPKRQTIRGVGKRRHAQPGDDLQLYAGMRTKQCELIGNARCTEAVPITIRFPKPYRPGSLVRLPSYGIVLAKDLDAFAIRDGFDGWDSFRRFWHENHPGVVDFDGIMIRWEPLA